MKQAAFSKAGCDASDASKDIQELKTQVKGLTDLIKGIAKQPKTPTSYADVLRSKGDTPTTGRPDSQRVQPVPARRARELVVAPGTETATQKHRTSLELVRDINSATNGSGDVIAARRLPSGDVLVAFQSVLEKQKWEDRLEVLQTFGIGARFRTREYTVLAHGVQVRSVNQADQTRAIEAIYSQNPRLRGLVRIVRVGWAKKTLKAGKRLAALHIGIAEPDQANLLIDTGLLMDSELHDCELFDSSCYITQCFKCYQYNHTAKHCKSVARCGFCGVASHSSQDCGKKDDRTAFHCIPCRKQGHVSWARECPIRRRQVEKAQQAYACRPSKFQTRTTSPTSNIRPTASTLPETTTTIDTYTTAIHEDSSSESIIEVEMPDQEMDLELESEPLVPAQTLERSRKRTRATRATRATSDSESDFPDLQGYSIVRRRQHKATQQGRTSYSQQDIRDVLVPQSSLYE